MLPGLGSSNTEVTSVFPWESLSWVGGVARGQEECPWEKPSQTGLSTPRAKA